MQAITMNPAAMTMAANGIGGQQYVANGDFAALIAEMLGTESGLDTGGLAGGDWMAQLLGTMKSDEDDGNANAMELMAAMMTQNQTQFDWMQNLSDNGSLTIGNTGQTLGGVEQLQAVLLQQSGQLGQLGQTDLTGSAEQMMMQGLTQSEQQAVRRETAFAVAQSMATAISSVKANGKDSGTAQANDPLQGLAEAVLQIGSQSSSSSFSSQLDPLMNAYNRLYTVAADTANTEVGKQEQTLKTDSLQAATNIEAFVAGRQLSGVENAQVEQVAPHEVMTQVRDAVVQHLETLTANSKNDELVIKLKPEGLGQVTVKLVENAGKISLSIVTSTQQTQNALNGEIGALREALQPYNAEVTQIVSNSQAAMSQQQSMGEHNHNHGSSQDGTRHGQGYFTTEDDTPEENLQAYASLLGSTLNAYI